MIELSFVTQVSLSIGSNMKTLAAITILLSLSGVSYQAYAPQVVRKAPEPVCRQVPKEVCNQVARQVARTRRGRAIATTAWRTLRVTMAT